MKTFYSYIALIIFMFFLAFCDKDSSDDNQYWTSLSLGNAHTCGITNHETVQCFGSNHKGQIGVGPTDYISTPKPQKVVGLKNIQKLYNDGLDSTCALDNQEGLFCWGRNDHGQLGLGHNNVVYRPAFVNEGLAAHFLFLGPLSGYLIDQSGTPYQFGNLTGTGVFSKPVKDDALPKNIKQIYRHFGEVCYLDKEEQIACREKPIFDKATKFERLDGEGLTLCALAKDKKLWCGKISGPGHFEETKASIFSDKSVVDFCVAAHHICALDVDGDIYCAGANEHGQLGQGDKTASGTLKKVSVIQEKAKAVYCENRKTCAITVTNKVFCVGSGLYQSLGSALDQDTYIKGIELPKPSF